MEVRWRDLDWLCTFEDDGVQGYIYVQTTPVDINLFCVPSMSVVQAEISIDGQVEPLQNASYDYGGNHANDFLNFDYGGKSYEYNHSSLGYGGRSCQPMDCTRVDDGQAVEDGCTMDRTLPVVCVAIEPDGTHADLVDTFAPCPGDPNYE